MSYKKKLLDERLTIECQSTEIEADRVAPFLNAEKTQFDLSSWMSVAQAQDENARVKRSEGGKNDTLDLFFGANPGSNTTQNQQKENDPQASRKETAIALSVLAKSEARDLLEENITSMKSETLDFDDAIAAALKRIREQQQSTDSKTAQQDDSKPSMTDQEKANVYVDALKRACEVKLAALCRENNIENMDENVVKAIAALFYDTPAILDQLKYESAESLKQSAYELAKSNLGVNDSMATMDSKSILEHYVQAMRDFSSQEIVQTIIDEDILDADSIVERLYKEVTNDDTQKN